MNVAVIFAGGVGKRMKNSELPKQFMEICGKPIIIHTLEVFEKTNEIDGVFVACVESWIDYLKDLLKKYNIKKVIKIVPGGETGQLSIYNGIKAAYEYCPENTIVLIHDGVRPFIDSELIVRNIECVKMNSSSISCVPATETFLITDGNSNVLQIPSRNNSMIAKAPQSFYLKDIFEVHQQALKDGVTNSIDSCTLMSMYNKKLSVVITDYDNIKITTPEDLYIGTCIYNSRMSKEEKNEL